MPASNLTWRLDMCTRKRNHLYPPVPRPFATSRCARSSSRLTAQCRRTAFKTARGGGATGGQCRHIWHTWSVWVMDAWKIYPGLSSSWVTLGWDWAQEGPLIQPEVNLLEPKRVTSIGVGLIDFRGLSGAIQSDDVAGRPSQ